MSDCFRVLIADDHESVRWGLRALLEAHGAEVVGEAGDGDAALSLVVSTAPDVVVLDLSMRPSGLECLRRIKAANADVGVLIFTRHRDVSILRQCIDAGAAGLILKQSPFEELCRAARCVANGETYLDPAIRGVIHVPRNRASTGLSRRETQVLRRSSAGEANKVIAHELSISIKTVEVHKANAMRKLGLRDRADLLRYALVEGWLDES